jgi:hypothetical protein
LQEQINKSIEEAKEALEKKRKSKQLNMMSRNWGKESKESYLKFLQEVTNGEYISSPIVDPNRTTLFSTSNDNYTRNDKYSSKGSQYFEEIKLKLANLELKSELNTISNHQNIEDRNKISDRISDMMISKEQNDKKSRDELLRLEEETRYTEEKEDINREDDTKKKIEMRRYVLSVEEEESVSRALSAPHNDTVIIEKFNQDITRKKMSCLRPGKYI